MLEETIADQERELVKLNAKIKDKEAMDYELVNGDATKKGVSQAAKRSDLPPRITRHSQRYAFRMHAKPVRKGKAKGGGC